MTAEIAVMNASGVALAADSAVTIGKGAKIYNSANKLFSISKYHPVGVMVYGNAKYLNIPWETIVKVYRENLSEQHFETLEEYTQDFLSFLVNNNYNELTSNRSETTFILNSLESNIIDLFETLLQSIKDKSNEIADLSYSQEELNQILTEHAISLVEEILYNLDNQEFINGFNDDDLEVLINEFGDNINQMINIYFENFLLSDDWPDKIKYIVCCSIFKKFSNRKSGIVFAGFGERELYPSVYSFNIEGRINGKLKYEITNSRSIGKGSSAAVIPFAQSDMVHTFIRGIDRDIEELSNSYLNGIFNSLPKIIVEQLQSNFINEVDMKNLEKSIESGLLELYNNYKQEIEKFKKKNFTDPVLEIVHSLPKEELADIAEALINLTSFKKKVSSTLESVGGPIDVAVITKGDGFIWIKRKHYFEFEKNRHFFEKYYWRDENEADNSRKKLGE